MKNVRKTLQIFLRSLPESCYFDIVDFGSSFESLFGRPTKYCDETLQTAVKSVDQKDASMGGESNFRISYMIYF